MGARWRVSKYSFKFCLPSCFYTKFKIPETDMIDELVGGSAEAKLEFSNNAAESVDENMNTAEPAVENMNTAEPAVENMNTAEPAVDTTKKIVEDANTMADGPSLSAGGQFKMIYVFLKGNTGIKLVKIRSRSGAGFTPI